MKNLNHVTFEYFTAFSFNFKKVLEELDQAYIEGNESLMEDLGYLLLLLLGEITDTIEYGIDYCDWLPDESFMEYSEMYEYFYKHYSRHDYDEGDIACFLEAMA